MIDVRGRGGDMEFNYLQRVKVYRLNGEGKWDDKGTGHVSVEFLERSDAVGLVVIDEEDNQTVLVHRISGDDIYRRQEDTFISWMDPEAATDLALGFQETMGCTFIWDQICKVQRSFHFPAVAGDGRECGPCYGGSEVLRLENLLRMAVVWLLCLVYSYMQYHAMRMRLPHRRHAWERLDFPAHPKPACIVTGASSGIGRATATALAQRGFHVILAGRSLARLKVVRDEIGASGASCEALAVDLSCVASILRFSRTVKELFEGHDAPGVLQLLVNNAGVIAASQRWTEDGFDVMTASNYIGPYILTRELLSLLQKNAPQARIVNVVSFTHRALRPAQLDLSQLRSGGIRPNRSHYPLARIYEASKLFLILHCYELHRRVFSQVEPEARVSIMAADPGYVSTELLREVPAWLVRASILVMRLLGLWQAPAAGASAVVAAALAPWEVSGQCVFGDQGLSCNSSSLSYNEQLGRSLWEASEGICQAVIDKYGN